MKPILPLDPQAFSDQMRELLAFAPGRPTDIEREAIAKMIIQLTALGYWDATDSFMKIEKLARRAR